MTPMQIADNSIKRLIHSLKPQKGLNFNEVLAL